MFKKLLSQIEASLCLLFFSANSQRPLYFPLVLGNLTSRLEVVLYKFPVLITVMFDYICLSLESSDSETCAELIAIISF